jgi:hypothetical protein
MESSSRILDPDCISILDPESRGQKSTGSRIRIRNTDFKTLVPKVSDHRNSTVNLTFPKFAQNRFGPTTRCSIKSHSQNWIKFHLNEIRK